MLNCNYAAFKILRQTDAVVTTSTTMFFSGRIESLKAMFASCALRDLQRKMESLKMKRNPDSRPLRSFVHFVLSDAHLNCFDISALCSL